MTMLAETLSFRAHELVRNQQHRILTISKVDEEGHVYVEEEPTPYTIAELEKIDQTNIIKFRPHY